MFMATERNFFKVEISTEAKRKFDGFYQGRGMSQVEAGTRIIEWFLAQDEVVQLEILGHLPREMRPDIARLVLTRMINPAASPKASSAPPESRQAIVEAIQQAADRSMQPSGPRPPSPPHTEGGQKEPPAPRLRKKN